MLTLSIPAAPRLRRTLGGFARTPRPGDSLPSYTEKGGFFMPARVVLAMSGGVDSSVAAYLLKKQGYEVIGLFMRTGAHGAESDHLPAHKKGCCSALDAGDARRVADRLDIPFYALDFEEDFGRIMDYFADEYLSGRTPNPCVMC